MKTYSQAVRNKILCSEPNVEGLYAGYLSRIAKSKQHICVLLQVKARSAAREVIATYSVDDIFIELVIQLPQNYPLGSIAVDSGRRVGIALQQWRNWMLQLSTYLTHQVKRQICSRYKRCLKYICQI